MAKSWDIQPNAPRRAAPVSAPAPAPVRKARRPRKRKPLPKIERAGGVPLKRRRQLKRRRFVVLGLVLFVVALIALEVVVWQPWFRVARVEARGPSADQLPAFVTGELRGSRYFLVPRNSIFFLPESQLRTRILAQFPDVSAVSIAPKGLTTLSVKAIGRESIFWWCGSTHSAPLGTCYETDSDGLIYAPVAGTMTGSTTPANGMLRVYSTAEGGNDPTQPLGAHMLNAAHIPGMMQFVKEMRSLGADVVAVEMRGDEADLYTNAGTRITYVLGKEAEAAALAHSSFSMLNLNDGSLSYVDLRFAGKIFYKKKGAP